MARHDAIPGTESADNRPPIWVEIVPQRYIPVPSGRHRPRKRRGRIAVTIAVVVIVAGATFTFLQVSRGTSSDASGAIKPPTAELPATAIDWLKSNVGRSERVLAEPTAMADLMHAQFPFLELGTVDTFAQTGCSSYTYVISDAAARAASGALANCLATSVGVASFGTGANAVEVKKVIVGALAEFRQRLDADAVARRLGGASLLINPHVTVGAAARAVLAAGQLDLRATTLLALLAEQARITVVDAPADPAETAAGLPVRTLDLIMGRGADLTTTLTGLTMQYQPDSLTELVGGRTRVHWSVAPAIATPLR